MASSGSVFSQMLQEITTTKLRELANKRKTFEQQKASAIKPADSQHDPLDMLTAPANGAIACFPVAIKDGKIVRGSSMNPRLETDLRNLNRFIDQARFDPSVSHKTIQQWKETLLKHLETQSLKYQYADFYGQLTMECLTASGKVPQTETQPQGSDTMDASSDFEEVSAKAKLKARQNWEQSVFEEAKVDQSAIEKFLNGLYGSKEAQKALKELHQDVTDIESTLRGNNQIPPGILRWTIKGLLPSALLTNEKRQVLRDFQSTM